MKERRDIKSRRLLKLISATWPNMTIGKVINFLEETIADIKYKGGNREKAILRSVKDQEGETSIGSFINHYADINCNVDLYYNFKEISEDHIKELDGCNKPKSPFNF